MLTGKFTNISAAASSFEQAAQKLPRSWAPCHVPGLPSLTRWLFANTRCQTLWQAAPYHAQHNHSCSLIPTCEEAPPSPHRTCVHAAEHCRYRSPSFFSMAQRPFLIESSQLAQNTTGSTACPRIRHSRLLILEVWWVIFFKT